MRREVGVQDFTDRMSRCIDTIGFGNNSVPFQMSRQFRCGRFAAELFLIQHRENAQPLLLSAARGENQQPPERLNDSRPMRSPQYRGQTDDGPAEEVLESDVQNQK